MNALAFLIIAGTLVYAAMAKAKTPEPESSTRREVKGKSGKTWFTESHADDADGGSVITNVFASPSTNDLVLTFRQFTGGANTGKRQIMFQAPSSLTATAVKDFI